MAKKVINIDNHPLTWEKVSSAISDINDNFDELYGGTGIAGSLIPDTDVTYDLGSPDFRFKDLYLSGSTINLGGAVISANPDGTVNVPGGIQGGFSLVGFSQESNGGSGNVSPDGKDFVFTSPEIPGWTQGVTIFTNADHLYPNLVRPGVSWVEGMSGEIISVRIFAPGVNYPATEYGGVYETQSGELTTDIGFTKIGPNDSEVFTVVDLGNSFGYQFYVLNPLTAFPGFSVDTVARTVTGTATAQGTFDGVDYVLTFGLKYKTLGAPGPGDGLIVDPATSSITLDGLTTTTAEHIRKTGLGSNGRDYTLVLAYNEDTSSWVLRDLYDNTPAYSKTDFTINFDKLLSIGNFQPLWAPQTSVQAVGDSAIRGDLTVFGNVTLAQTLVLNPGAEPPNPTFGTIAIADGVSWDPVGDGSKQMMLFLDGGWNIVNLTPVTP